MGRSAAAKKAARARAKREGTRPATSTWVLPSTATARCCPARAAAAPTAVPEGWLVPPQQSGPELQPVLQPEPEAEPEPQPVSASVNGSDAHAAAGVGRNLRPAIWRQLLRHEGPALSGPWGEYSFEQLRGLMSSLVACLCPAASAAGCCSMRVGLLCDEGPVIPLLELTVAALLPHGSCFVPLDPTMPAKRLHFLMHNAGVTSIVTTPGYYDAVLAPLLLEPGAAAAQCDRVIVLDFAEGECWLDRARSQAYGGPVARKQPARVRLNQHLARSATDESSCNVEAESKAAENDRSPPSGSSSRSSPSAARAVTAGGAIDPLYLIYTSGTTGAPKGVLGETGALFTYLGRSDCMRRVPGDRVLLCGAVTWDPSVSDVFGTLVGTIDDAEEDSSGGVGATKSTGGGATLILERRARLVTRLDLCVEDWAVTHVLATPALWRMVFAATSAPTINNASITEGERDPAVVCGDDRLLSLRSLQLGGEAWSASEVFQPRNLQILQNIYGTTENVVYQAVGPNLVAGAGCGSTAPSGSAALTGLHAGILFRVVLEDVPSESSGLTCGPENEVTSSATATGELLIGGSQVLSYHVPNTTQRPFPGEGGHPQSHEAAEEVARLNRTKFFTGSDSVRWFRTGDRVDAQITPGQQQVSWKRNSACAAAGSSNDNHCHLALLAGSVLVSAFTVAGRLDRQVKINGYRVELDEIEAVLEQAPALAMQPGSAVVCHYFAEEKRLLAFVDRPGTAILSSTTGSCTHQQQSESGAAEEAAALVPAKKVCFDDLSVVLRAFCESQMPKWQVPHRFVGVHVPLTTSGKVDRAAVLAAWRHKQSERDDDTVGAAGPSGVAATELRTPFERLLGTIWSDLFPAAAAASGKISARSHFFELGGTSVLAVQMVARIASASSAGGGAHAAMVDDAHARHRRLCGLINTPRLREYARFLEEEVTRRATIDPNISMPPPDNVTGLGAGGVAADAGAQQAAPQQFRKKKGRRKRRDLRSGLQRHTIHMFEKHITAPGGLADQEVPTATAVEAEAEVEVEVRAAGVETTEAEVLRLARACGDVHAAETLELAMAAAANRAPAVGGTACG
jgi:acyl-CoA synthetase (AMP-forming)/AMP-acid ligase II